MAIEFNCPFCKALIRVPDSAGGGKGKCPKCATRLTVPKASASKRAAPPPAEQPVLFAAPPAAESPFAGTAAPPVVEETAFSLTEDSPEVFEEPDPMAAFGFDEPSSSSLDETPSRSTRPAVRPKVSVAVRVARGLWVVPVVVALGLAGVAGWYIWQQYQSEQLGGELVAEWADELELSPVLIEKSSIKQPPDDVEAVLVDLEKSPVPLRSPMMQVQLRGSKRGVHVTVNTGQVSRFYRVDVNGDKALAKYLKKHEADFEERRMKGIEQAATAFAVEYRKVIAKKADHSSLTEYRDSLALPGLVRGVGHQVVATYGSTIYPCVYEDLGGALYFLLPPDAKEFEIMGRKIGESVAFPARYKVTVVGMMKVPAKKGDNATDNSKDKKSKKKPGPVFKRSDEPEEKMDSKDEAAMKKGE